MRLRIPGISATKFARSFMMRQASRKIAEVLDTLGEKNLRYLLENDKDLASLVPREKELQYRQMAQKYQELAQLFTEEDLVNMLPSWVIELVDSFGDKGQAWLKRQMEWLKGFF